MSSIPDRKEQLAAKRAQLAKLKAEREARGKNKAKKPSEFKLEDFVGKLDLPEATQSIAAKSKSLAQTKDLLWPVSIAPVETNTYSKLCQVDPEELEPLPTAEDGTCDDDELPTMEPEPESNLSPTPDEPAAEPELEPVPDVPELTEEEKAKIQADPEFTSFIENASRVIERVLSMPYDPTMDYVPEEDDDADNMQGAPVWLNETVDWNHKTTDGRVVTALDWSPANPEWLCAAYNENPNTPDMPDGLVMVWSTKQKFRPEYIFECQSSVLSVSFCEYSPSLIAGGTYSGQVVVWDIRTSKRTPVSEKRTPVQRSNINSNSHTHPVFCLNIAGTKNAHFLVSTSTDGKMCTWDLDALSEPRKETLELQSGANKPIAGTCFSFPVHDANNFVLGAEDGSIFQACLHGAKAGLIGSFEEIGADHSTVSSHHGPVTGVDFFRATTKGDFSHLFLSSSTDWTTKLWSYRDTTRPLKTFDNSQDYVYDVKWSPVNPAVFATADGMGNLDIWHLNKNLEEPFAKIAVGESKTAINKISWSGDGKHIAVGGSDGKVCLVDVADRLGQPGADEGMRLKNTLKDIQEGLQEAAGAAV